MDTQFKTSFIPKKPIEATASLATPGRSPRRVGRTIFSLIGIMIFVATLAALGGTYLWKIKLSKDIEGQIADLQTAKKEFDERFVQEASRLNLRIEQASYILDNHVSPSSLYALLEEYTLQTVAFKSLSFADNQDGTLSIQGNGDAARYESIVLQSDAFGRSGFLRNVIFTNLSQSQTDNSISFSFEATLDPRLILYRNSLPTITNEQN